MKSWKETFSGRKTKYGMFSTITALFVIAILVVANLVVDQLNIKFDLTKEKLYGITETTKETIGKLQEDITIYTLFRTGSENPLYSEILDQYTKHSPHIKVENKDPYMYQAFVQSLLKQDEKITPDSIIIKGPKRTKLILASELVKYDFDYQTYEQYPVSIDIEPKVTNAIVYVTQDKTDKVYALTGHNETPIPESYITLLKDINFDYETLDLLKTASVPDDCNVLLLTTPERDLSPDEAQKIIGYLQKGGRAFVAIDYVAFETPNLSLVLETYGVTLTKAFVFEGDPKRFYPNNPIFSMPQMDEHTINNSILKQNYQVILGPARPINESPLKKKTTTLETLLQTTPQSYAKTNVDVKSINKEATDISGPFVLATGIVDSFYAADKTFTTKLVVIGTESIMYEEINSINYGANSMFLLNAMNWLVDKSEADSVYVQPKPIPTQPPLMLTQNQAELIKLYARVLLPICIFGFGLFVWLRRRNR